MSVSSHLREASGFSFPIHQASDVSSSLAAAKLNMTMIWNVTARVSASYVAGAGARPALVPQVRGSDPLEMVLETAQEVGCEGEGGRT